MFGAKTSVRESYAYLLCLSSIKHNILYHFALSMSFRVSGWFLVF